MKLHPSPPFLRPLLGRPGLLIAFLWGFSEATLFFIVPDVFITLTALFAIKKSIHHMLLVTAGALLGGALMFLLASTSPAPQVAVSHVPFVSPKMFTTAAQNYASFGPAATLVGPMSGIPYKIYAVLAPPHLSLPTFLLMSIPARLERFLITWLTALPVGLFLRSRQKTHTTLMLTIWALYWITIYSIYWTVI